MNKNGVPPVPQGGHIINPVKQVQAGLSQTLVLGSSAVGASFRNDDPGNPAMGRPPMINMVTVGGFHRLEQAALTIAAGMARDAAIMDEQGQLSVEDFGELAKRLAKSVLDVCCLECWNKPPDKAPEVETSPSKAADDAPNYGDGSGG